jgi:1-acyl-sn-glycerol-3-phosphate acyltransferase
VIYIIAVIIILLFDYTDALYYASNIISKILTINYIYDNDNIKMIDNYVNSDEKILITVNHRSAFDVLLFLSMFKKLSCVIFSEGPDKIPLLSKISKKFKNLCVGKKNTVQKIIEFTNNRKKGDNILIIAPDECRYPDDITECNIAKFRTGAFVPMVPIVPIIIKYEDTRLDYMWENKETLYHAFFKVFLSKDYNIKVKVLDKVCPDENSTIEQYRDKVRKIMSDEYDKL